MTPGWHIYVVLLIWSLLTILAAGICCTCCLLPFWISGSVNYLTYNGGMVSSISYLGLFRRCGYPSYRPNGDVEWTHGCGYYPALETVPHWVWRMALIFLILSACLLVFLACFVVCAGACTALLRTNAKLSRACSYVYFLAGSLCLTSCFIYPFGWSNNSEINQICGDESGTFKLGRCEIGWAYVLTVAGGVISIVLSGMPNLLQSLLSRNSRTQNRLPMISSTDGKYPLITQNNLPRMTHSWYNPDNSVFVNGNSVSERVRRRPQSLVVSPDPNAMWDFSRRLSCSVFGSIPEHGQNELVSNNLSVSQSFGTLPENDTTLKAFADSKKDQQASCQKSDSAENTS